MAFFPQDSKKSKKLWERAPASQGRPRWHVCPRRQRDRPPRPGHSALEPLPSGEPSQASSPQEPRWGPLVWLYPLPSRFQEQRRSLPLHRRGEGLTVKPPLQGPWRWTPGRLPAGVDQRCSLCPQGPRRAGRSGRGVGPRERSRVAAGACAEQQRQHVTVIYTNTWHSGASSVTSGWPEPSPTAPLVICQLPHCRCRLSGAVFKSEITLFKKYIFFYRPVLVRQVRVEFPRGGTYFVWGRLNQPQHFLEGTVPDLHCPRLSSLHSVSSTSAAMDWFQITLYI